MCFFANLQPAWKGIESRILAANGRWQSRLVRSDPQTVIIKALDQISIDIKHGDRVALVGRNGSGKTNTPSSACWHLSPPRGEYQFEDVFRH
ncbi:ATP-binding cassette domain-containing protein [Cupriavidus basilensis]